MIFVHITSSLDRVRVDFPTTLRASQGHNSINLEHFKHRQKYIYLHKLLIAWLPHDLPPIMAMGHSGTHRLGGL